LSRQRPRWIAFVLVAAALAVGWPLVSPGSTTHTTASTLSTTPPSSIERCATASFPCAGSPTCSGGRGLPLFNYYHPLAFYLVALVHLFGPGFIAAMKLVTFATLPLSAWAMLAWLEEHVPPEAAAVGAAAYVAAPIHVLELHVKGDPPAALAFRLRAARVARHPARRFRDAPRHPGAGVGQRRSRALPFRHALLLIPALAGYAWIELGPSWLRPAARIAAGAALGALVSAWHWGPALGERALVYIDSPHGILAFDWREQFVAWWQLLSPLWGYHGSFPGTPDDMSFQLGPAHVAAVGLCIWGFKYLHGRRRTFALWALASSAFAIVMTLAISRPVVGADRHAGLRPVPVPVPDAGRARRCGARRRGRGVTSSTARARRDRRATPVLSAIFAITDRSVLYAAIAVFQAAVGCRGLGRHARPIAVRASRHPPPRWSSSRSRCHGRRYLCTRV
jgi:hypothetical protein